MVRVGRQLPQALSQLGLYCLRMQRSVAPGSNPCSSPEPKMDHALLPENLVRLVNCMQVNAESVGEFTD